jgi:hypothetical protein
MKVAILGQGPRTLDIPADYQVWVINGPTFPVRWDRLYQLHSLQHLKQVHGPAFLEMLATIRAPYRLVMTSTHATIPAAEAYPWKHLLATAGPRWYFTHSTPLLLAHAWLEGADEILLDGFSDRPGLEAEKACVVYHVARCEAAGVPVTVTPAYNLFPGPTAVYGLQEARWIEQWEANR